MVLLNKSDLLYGDALDGGAEVRSGVATQVKLVDAVHGAIDPKILLGMVRVSKRSSKADGLTMTPTTTTTMTISRASS